MGSAFTGVTVLDLSVAPGGAIAAMHLGEYGAYGDARRARTSDDSALWRYANRTKHVVPARDGLVEELATTADVVIVDLPGSELEAAGLTRRAAAGAQPVAGARVDAAARAQR